MSRSNASFTASPHGFRYVWDPVTKSLDVVAAPRWRASDLAAIAFGAVFFGGGVVFLVWIALQGMAGTRNDHVFALIGAMFLGPAALSLLYVLGRQLFQR